MSSPQASTGRVWVAFWLLLALAVGIRLHDLGRRSVWFDEAHTLLWVSGHDGTDVRERLGDRPSSPEEILAFQRATPERGVGRTIQALAREDPQHPPLYFAAARIWAAAFGSSIGTLRALSGLLGLLMLPGAFLLGRELRRDTTTGMLTALIVALSPFHVFYAREARPYSMLAAAVVWSTFLLLRARRHDRALDWVYYTISVTIGLYTHLVFAFVLVSHLLHMLLDGRHRPSQRRVGRFVFSSATATLLFVPWAVVLARGLDRAGEQLAWTSTPIATTRLIGSWAFNYSSLFVDLSDVAAFTNGVAPDQMALYALRCGFLVLIAVAVVKLSSESDCRALLLSLAAVPLLTIASLDLSLGGLRSASPRFMIVSFVGVQLVVALTLAPLLRGRHRSQKLAQGITTLVIVASAASSLALVTAEFWWYAPGRSFARDVAAVVNESPSSVVQELNGRLLVLAHHYGSHVTVLPVTGDVEQLPDGYDVFVLSPPDKVLADRTGVTLEPTRVPALWKLHRLPDAFD